MNNKKNVLIICSWLNVKNGIGSFFIEQAVIASEAFNIKLVYFKGYKFGIKKGKKIIFSIKIENEKIANNIDVFTVNYPIFKIDFIQSFFNKIVINRVTKFFTTNKIDLIHAQSLFDAGFWAYEIFKIKKIPYIFTEHNQFTLSGIKSKKQKILSKVIENASLKLVVSDDLIRQFATNNIFTDFTVIGNTFDESTFFYNPLPNSKFTIVTIGAYTPIKDYVTMLEALKICDHRLSNKINFYWIGYNGWGENNDEKISKILKNYNYDNIEVILIDRAGKKMISEILNKADVFMSSSICETFGVSVLESLACGVPVIVTQSGGINELINNNNGIIIPIKNANEMANSLFKLLNNEVFFDKEKISLEIKSKFGSTIFRQRITSIYNKKINH